MKILPLLALAGGAYFFMNKDKKKATSTETVTSRVGSKEIGYEIINCNKLIIHDKEKAFQWAFGLGALEAIKLQSQQPISSVEMLLLGDCFEKFEFENFKTDEEKIKAKEQVIAQFKKLLNTKAKAKFLFELYQWTYTGFVKALISEPVYVLDALAKMREQLIAKTLGYDVSDLIVELKG